MIPTAMLIGLDTISAFWTLDTLNTCLETGQPLTKIDRITADGLQQQIMQGEVEVLDVRSASEYAAGHIMDSHNIPLGYLRKRMHELPADRPMVIHCQSGTHSVIATSLLTAQRRTHVTNLVGGFDSWKAAGLPITHEAQAAVLEPVNP